MLCETRNNPTVKNSIKINTGQYLYFRHKKPHKKSPINMRQERGARPKPKCPARIPAIKKLKA
jgi:hypothetical protein